MVIESQFKNKVSQWNYLYLFILMGGLFLLLSGSLINLQVVQSSELKERAAKNQLFVSYEYPNRGVIFDRNGIKVAENIPASSLIFQSEGYIKDGKLDSEKVSQFTSSLTPIIGDKWQSAQNEGESYTSLDEMILKRFEQGIQVSEYGYVSLPREILILSDLSNDETIKLKSLSSTLEGIKIEEGDKRFYPMGESFTHILGYTSLVIAEDLEDKDYLGYDEFVAGNGYRDQVGRLGIEAVYDSSLIGRKGVYAYEVNAENARELSATKSGLNLYLSIDAAAQNKMYEILNKYVEKHGATGGSGIIQDVNSGEVLVMVTSPSYNNNDFIGGISNEKYSQLLDDPRLPLFNRSISAQLPPGSTFKTLTGAAAYDAAAINLNTIYVSRRGYTFPNGAPFREFRDSEYGPLNLYGAIQRSSNIYFCEALRNWDIDELVPYYKSFGIGENTGIDLIGETPGRLPSPENKIALANTPGITWLDPVWYPEGDGCSTVIGQGITLVTPIQMANWVSAIANGGTLHTPHLAIKKSNSSGELETLTYSPLNKDFIKSESLEVMREAMMLAVEGDLRSVYALTDAKTSVGAKTGTAEFGALNADGVYEHTHAWVTGFFPYENPQYSFVILLEDGGESSFAAEASREYLDWWVDEGPGIK